MLRRLLRSNSGCYTCRLRRKKCSEDRPICQECKSLEITCHYVDEKPDWMDGGPRQKEMSDSIKAQVKKQASQRRDRKYLDMLESGSKMSIGDSDEAAVGKSGKAESHVLPPLDVDTTMSPNSHHTNNSANAGTSKNVIANGISNVANSGSQNSANSPPEIPWHSQLFARQEDTEGAPDLHLLMVYLDFIFPYLFPHYKPPVLAGGRGWILDVIQSNRTVYFTSISLASYYFGICLAGGNKEHLACTNVLVDNLESQFERGLQELQKEMGIINSAKSGFDQRKGLVVMQSILQMLVFEISTSNKDNWMLHLNAAIALFVKILPDPDLWTETLHSFYTPRWPPPSMGMRRPWSTNQAALRFFTAELLYVDVISSTTLGSPPKLHRYQAGIIPAGSAIHNAMEPQPAGPLFMEEFIGLRNWILQIIGEIAGLDSWKKSQRRAGSLSMNELVSRGEVLGAMIKNGLTIWESEYSGDQGPLCDHINVVSKSTIPGAHAGHSKAQEGIWLLAALSYLNVVISGWQPSSPEIQWSVAKTTELLANLPSPADVRAVTWPLCVSGCLSPAGDEDKYRAMVQQLGPLQIFGTTKEAMGIMERVWASRGSIDETWDVARCMNVLGHGVLLI